MQREDHPKSRIFPFGDATRNVHYEKFERRAGLSPKVHEDMLTGHYLLTVDRLPHTDLLLMESSIVLERSRFVFWFVADPTTPYLALSCFSDPALSFEDIPSSPAAVTEQRIDAAEVPFSSRSFMTRSNLTDIRVLCLVAICKIVRSHPRI